jgi:hypothetical protein
LTRGEATGHLIDVIAVLHTPPKVEADPQYGWQITFWLGDAFEYSIPFRAAIVGIISILDQTAPAILDLPTYHPNDDFVKRSLMFGRSSLKVYFEYSLGYLAIMSASRAVLEDVVSRLLPSVRVV